MAHIQNCKSLIRMIRVKTPDTNCCLVSLLSTARLNGRGRLPQAFRTEGGGCVFGVSGWQSNTCNKKLATRDMNSRNTVWPALRLPEPGEPNRRTGRTRAPDRGRRSPLAAGPSLRIKKYDETQKIKKRRGQTQKQEDLR